MDGEGRRKGESKVDSEWYTQHAERAEASLRHAPRYTNREIDKDRNRNMDRVE